MAVTTNSLTLGTFNSRGYATDRRSYVGHLMSLCHILFIQEHWLFDRDMAQLCDSLSGIGYIGVSGMEQGKLIAGRPYGGTAILYRESMNCKVKCIECKNRRLCACSIALPNGVSILLMNVYMPYERLYDASALEELIHVLDDASQIIESQDSIDHVVFGGDLNSDLTRVQSKHIAPLRNFCHRYAMRFCCEHPLNSVDFTYTKVM